MMFTPRVRIFNFAFSVDFDQFKNTPFVPLSGIAILALVIEYDNKLSMSMSVDTRQFNVYTHTHTHASENK